MTLACPKGHMAVGGGAITAGTCYCGARLVPKGIGRVKLIEEKKNA